MERRSPRDFADTPALAFWAGLALALKQRVLDEWRATGFYRLGLERPAPKGFAASPRDFRPTDEAAGKAVLAGRFVLAGAAFDQGPGSDPWDTASPTRLFAVQLHRFAWLPDLMATGDAGAREAIRLFLDWRAVFGRVAPFAWSAETLERRVYNLACAARRIAGTASEAEATALAGSLAAQARHLSRLRAPSAAREAERHAVTAIAGAVLVGAAGDQLLAHALPNLTRALRIQVLPDGGVKNRSPQAALELLLDLLTLDDALLQLGREAPQEVSRAIDRLTGAVRFFTLGDGRLASFHGGEGADPARIEAARLHDDGEAKAFGYAPHSGYHRLTGRSLQVIVDAAPPPDGPWSTIACAHPLALEVVAGRDRLIANTAWSPGAAGPQALRRTDGGCTAALAGHSAGHPLTGFEARTLGPRLAGGPHRVDARRNEDSAGVWVELAHDGWAARFGLVHERRLFLDPEADELRGEDHFAPAHDHHGARRPMPIRAAMPFVVRFHLHPEVQVSLARDRRSVLLRGPSNRGWWFRNDAEEVALEPSVHFDGGVPRRSVQIVLKGEAGPHAPSRVRWKLAAVEPAKD